VTQITTGCLNQYEPAIVAGGAGGDGEVIPCWSG